MGGENSIILYSLCSTLTCADAHLNIYQHLLHFKTSNTGNIHFGENVKDSEVKPTLSSALEYRSRNTTEEIQKLYN